MSTKSKAAEDLGGYRNPRLDETCKSILKNKAYLIRIMKECVPEYRDCTLEEIERRESGRIV